MFPDFLGSAMIKRNVSLRILKRDVISIVWHTFETSFKISVKSVVTGSLVVRQSVSHNIRNTKITMSFEPPHILSQIRINEGLASTPAKHEPYHLSNGMDSSKLCRFKYLQMKEEGLYQSAYRIYAWHVTHV